MNPPGIFEAGVALLNSLIISFPANEFPPIFVEKMFPVLMELLLKTNDGGLMEEGKKIFFFLKKIILFQGTTCVSAFIRVVKAPLFQANFPGNVTGGALIFKFLDKLLSPEISEDAGRRVGNFVIGLISHVPEILLGNLPEILKRILAKLAKAELSYYIQVKKIKFFFYLKFFFPSTLPVPHYYFCKIILWIFSDRCFEFSFEFFR
jgi:hypothetical protein